MCIKFNTSNMFTNSPDPNDWQTNIRILFVIFLANSCIRSIASFATFIWYLAAVAVFAVALWKKNNKIYILLMIALVGVIAVEVMNFFANFSKEWGAGLIGVAHSFLTNAINFYTLYCSYKMFKDYPSGEGFQRQTNQPGNPNINGVDEVQAPNQAEYDRLRSGRSAL